MPEQLPPSISAFYASQIARSWHSIWAYAGSKLAWGVPIALVTAVLAGGVARLMSGTQVALIAGLAGALGAPVLILAAGFVWNFVRYPAVHEAELQTRITELGGAPDTPVAIPRALRGSNDRHIAAVLRELSEIVNDDMRRVCDTAKEALSCVNQIRVNQPSACASKTNEALTSGRAILNRLWTSANSGFLVAGDPEVLDVLRQAIQFKDRQIFIDFDQYARATLGQLQFLSLIESSADERRRLFEPALNLSDAPNRWEEAVRRYCDFIDRTNHRITEIRDQLTR